MGLLTSGAVFEAVSAFASCAEDLFASGTAFEAFSVEGFLVETELEAAFPAFLSAVSSFLSTEGSFSHTGFN